MTNGDYAKRGRLNRVITGDKKKRISYKDGGKTKSGKHSGRSIRGDRTKGGRKK